MLSIPPHFHFGQTNCTPELLYKFPPNEVPAFEGNSRLCELDNAITYCGSNEELWRCNPEAVAQVLQWVGSAYSTAVSPASTWVFSSSGIMNHNKQGTENAKEDVR